ncbi:hypothetical protein CNMCM5793_006030 [Aspergillus hiratsukae]|uniref:Helicase C-terminal domain-containing protein n=1 Tax=Aspergillus hiratsukae TaxID=1194566 RepID=A0A8H6PGT8_9EURO|nr:hypothetical protein CNMCM5793_006030 [Aspergillus hiratsukae]KAF7160346.1 hypothetical protein CNMCM6106_007787 [Aspergillus hiratsukae]
MVDIFYSSLPQRSVILMADRAPDTTQDDPDPFLFSQGLPFNNGVGDQDMMFVDQYDSNQQIDGSLIDQASFLQLGPEDAPPSRTSSTPVEFVTERDENDLDSSDLDAQVCYGTVVHQKVKLVGNGQELQEKVSKLKENNQWNQKFHIRHSSDKQLFLVFADGVDLGYLSEKMVRAVEMLLPLPRFELEAFTSLDVIIDAIRRARKPSDAAIRVNINVYGLKDSRDRVGKELSDRGLFLQCPMWMHAGRELHTEEDDEEDATSSPEADSPQESDEDFQETIAEVFRSLRRGEGLNRLEGTDNLNRALFPHQEEALDFMTQRETGCISSDYRLWQPKLIGGEQWFCHVITHTQQRERPDESGGGILADEMGMGKSLTTLVLIGKTMGDARQWVEHKKHLPGASLAETPCRATLVIVASRVNTWLREIDNHLNASLKVMIYHGMSRKDSIKDIECYDIVITTYNTLAKEHDAKLLARGKSPLHDFAWYRVVLDEGTPIQNSLADLASHLAFIQVRPFHEPRIFRHWIANPFGIKERKQRAIQSLSVLLEAICLRRTIERVDIPREKEEIRIVRLTAQERAQYKLMYADMVRFIIQQAGVYNDETSAFGVFQVWLQLRSFCNHGTYQPRFAWAKQNLLDEEVDSVRSLTRNSWDRCLACRQPLPIVTRDRRPSNAEPDGRLHCPLCESLRVSSLSGHASSETDEGSKMHDNFLLPDGYSSKVQALIADVRKDLDTTKSIVFSCWTRTLDLIARHLRLAKIQFERIDGKTLSSQRQKILDRFDGTNEVPVMIMTTGTGAFGLNLQSVNRVFIVEPQWNPSVESQAIARAIRLGQEQQVLVTRYLVEDSIEEVNRTRPFDLGSWLILPPFQDMCSRQMEKLKFSKMKFQ